MCHPVEGGADQSQRSNRHAPAAAAEPVEKSEPGAIGFKLKQYAVVADPTSLRHSVEGRAGQRQRAIRRRPVVTDTGKGVEESVPSAVGIDCEHDAVEVAPAAIRHSVKSRTVQCQIAIRRSPVATAAGEVVEGGIPGAVSVDLKHCAVVAAPAIRRHSVEGRAGQRQRAKRSPPFSIAEVVKNGVPGAIGVDLKHCTVVVAPALQRHSVEGGTGQCQSAIRVSPVTAAAGECVEKSKPGAIGVDRENCAAAAAPALRRHPVEGGTGQC